MKHYLFISLLAITMLTSCEKDNKETDENVCPVVEASNVPDNIKTAFKDMYPNQVVQVWFNKDNTGYSAYYVTNGAKKLVQFSNEGIFVKEEVKPNHETKDDSKDTTAAGKSSSTGCECEINNEHH